MTWAGEEQQSYAFQDQGVFQQIQAESSGTETSQEQPSIIQEYVLLLCRFQAVTMLDCEGFCLPKFSSSQHKLLVGISSLLGISGIEYFIPLDRCKFSCLI